LPDGLQSINPRPRRFALSLQIDGGPAMDQDDLPPKPADEGIDDTSFAGGIGVTFAGLVWIGIFATIGGLILWGVMHWLG